MKQKLAILILSFNLGLIAKVHCQSDTIVVISPKSNIIKQIRYKSWNLSLSKDTIFLGMKGSKPFVSELYSFLSKSPYVKFYDRKGRLIEEGRWNTETFIGAYRSYYQNGKVKTEGSYINDIKIDKWTYYSKNGKIKKQKMYITEAELNN